LPSDCRRLSRGIKISTAFSYPKTISIPPRREVSLPAYTTGEFLYTGRVRRKITPELLKKVIPDLMKYGLDPAPLYDLHLITFADLDLTMIILLIYRQ
jgi:hypothetical protein